MQTRNLTVILSKRAFKTSSLGSGRVRGMAVGGGAINMLNHMANRGFLAVTA